MNNKLSMNKKVIKKAPSNKQKVVMQLDCIQDLDDQFYET